MKTSTLALSFGTFLALAHALPTYVPRIPNGANVPDVIAVGHADHTGKSGDLDAFGEAFAKAGDQWTVALCHADSDGDGQTNGEELGDPCCVWTVGGTPTFSAGVSNPGDASSKVQASVLSQHTCNVTSHSPSPSTDATKTTETKMPASHTPSATSSADTVTTATITALLAAFGLLLVQ